MHDNGPSLVQLLGLAADRPLTVSHGRPRERGPAAQQNEARSYGRTQGHRANRTRLPRLGGKSRAPGSHACAPSRVGSPAQDSSVRRRALATAHTPPHGGCPRNHAEATRRFTSPSIFVENLTPTLGGSHTLRGRRHSRGSRWSGKMSFEPRPSGPAARQAPLLGSPVRAPRSVA